MFCFTPNARAYVTAAVFLSASVSFSISQDTDAKVWRVSSTETSKSCSIEKLDLIEAAHMIRLDKSCSSLHSPLVEAVKWVEDGYGNVDLLNAQNDKVASFASAEFDGMESVFPTYPILIIEPIR